MNDITETKVKQLVAFLNDRKKLFAQNIANAQKVITHLLNTGGGSVDWADELYSNAKTIQKYTYRMEVYNDCIASIETAENFAKVQQKVYETININLKYIEVEDYKYLSDLIE